MACALLAIKLASSMVATAPSGRASHATGWCKGRDQHALHLPGRASGSADLPQVVTETYSLGLEQIVSRRCLMKSATSSRAF
jgi:hypothetical protein